MESYDKDMNELEEKLKNEIKQKDMTINTQKQQIANLSNKEKEKLLTEKYRITQKELEQVKYQISGLGLAQDSLLKEKQQLEERNKELETKLSEEIEKAKGVMQIEIDRLKEELDAAKNNESVKQYTNEISQLKTEIKTLKSNMEADKLYYEKEGEEKIRLIQENDQLSILLLSLLLSIIIIYFYLILKYSSKIICWKSRN